MSCLKDVSLQSLICTSIHRSRGSMVLEPQTWYRISGAAEVADNACFTHILMGLRSATAGGREKSIAERHPTEMALIFTHGCTCKISSLLRRSFVDSMRAVSLSCRASFLFRDHSAPKAFTVETTVKPLRLATASRVQASVPKGKT